MNKSTLAVVRDLKQANQDFEWYPTTVEQIEVVADDIKAIKKDFDFNKRYREEIKVLDVGAGDGRVLQAIKDSFDDDESFPVEAYAVEKASVHTATYREKGITLIGTEFSQINFISKNCDVAFVNPPYSEFSYWVQTLIRHLNFSLLYAVIPQRWVEDKGIIEAMEARGIKFHKVLAESDFLNADRAARAKVNVVRFSFNDLDPESFGRIKDRRYKPGVNQSATDPFQLFLENELGLKKTYSQTTEKFSEYCEKARVKKEMETEGSEGFELVESKGILWALLDNYEIDLAKTLKQYKLISQIDAKLLQELGVDYDALRKGAKEKLLGYRNVYWSILFDKFDAISSRLTSKYKKSLLNTLASNALDFTYTNVIYIIQYAVEIGNEMIEKSLIEVYKGLTSPESILRYYKSNNHVYRDDWRYNRDAKDNAKYLLDYRFIHSNWTNFSSHSWERGISEGAREFTNDLLVAFKLLGYSDLYITKAFDDVESGKSVAIKGTHPNGNVLELVTLKFYLNGNRHLKFNQDAMLRFNVTVSRLLGWVRSKEDFVDESETTKRVDDDVWEISKDMKVTPSNIFLLTDKAA